MIPIITIVDAAASYDLTDLATAKIEIPGIRPKDEAYVRRAITSLSKAAAKRCGRVFVPETIAVTWRGSFAASRGWDAFHYGDGAGGAGVPFLAPHELVLPRRPVISIISVVEDDQTLVAGDDYEVEPEVGLLRRLVSDAPIPWIFAKLTVTLRAGYVDMPEDLVEGLLLWIKHKFYARARDPMLRSQEIPGVATEQYWVPNATGGSGDGDDDMPPDVADKILQYREAKV